MRPLRSAFGALAHVRDARAFHPKGILADGIVTALGRGLLPEEPTEVRARLSKGAGVPQGFRDVLGLAVRVPLETGQWDLTFSTVGPFGRVVPFPSSGWCDRPFSSLMPYRVDGRPRWLLAQAARGQPDVDASLRAARRLVRGGGFELVIAEASATDVPRPIALLRLHTVCADAALPAFDPILNHPPGVTLYPGWLAKAREMAYLGSREGRS
ncbi:hypothetical protein HFP15_28840 [Amycolatopsis sp. K13G38]|uniref:Phosphodiesterase n=1 Tax=Amycolatopsis acididurans TaxID=2724524 RepID=A0ABX1JAV1_9PSEU|nr:hypothetical protein [Amycolatopsis acididurans]NKQ56886.1 hypothetical protein [Amycolatopsis acididurans]